MAMLSQAVSILLVDDTDAQRYAIARTLTAKGFAVQEARTGTQALQLAQQQPDIILLDVMLPDLDGFEVCRRLKDDPATAHIPVIHLSAHLVQTEDRIHGFRGGADDYIAQPVTPEELVAKIGVWSRVRSAEADLRRKN